MGYLDCRSTPIRSGSLRRATRARNHGDPALGMPAQIQGIGTDGFSSIAPFVLEPRRKRRLRHLAWDEPSRRIGGTAGASRRIGAGRASPGHDAEQLLAEYTMKTYVPKKDDIQRQWFVVDAKGQVLGRLATQVAHVLTGKHKPGYVPFLDTGDFVVIINAGEVTITGKKQEQKMYRRHTGYPGGLKETQRKKVFAQSPETVIKEAVWGMMPKTKLGRAMIKKLKVYKGANHRHQAQQPVELKIQQ